MWKLTQIPLILTRSCFNDKRHGIAKPRRLRTAVYCVPTNIVSPENLDHYGDVIMGEIASQITSLTIVYSIVYSGTDQRKHQSSASLAFVRGIHRGPVNSPHKGPVTRKMFPFDDVIMITSLKYAHGSCFVRSWYLNLPYEVNKRLIFTSLERWYLCWNGALIVKYCTMHRVKCTTNHVIDNLAHNRENANFRVWHCWPTLIFSWEMITYIKVIFGKHNNPALAFIGSPGFALIMNINETVI